MSDTMTMPPVEEAEAPKKLKLREVSSDVARIQTALSHIFEPVSINPDGGQITVGLDAPRNPAPDVPWLHFTLDGALAAIQLSWGTVRRIAGLPLEGSIPRDIALLLEEALASALDDVEELLNISIRFVEMKTDRVDFPLSTTLNVHGKNAKRRLVQMRQVVALSFDAAAAFAAALEPRRRRRTELSGLNMHLIWETDEVMLSHEDFMSLEAGDAITTNLGEADTGFVILENQFRAPAKNVAGKLTLTGRFAPFSQKEIVSLSDTTAQGAQQNQPLTEADLDNVEVRLSFKAGEVRKTVGQLRALAPGAIIETTDPATTEIEIVANGNVVGAGELIEVNGRRAIQIRHIFSGY